MSVTSWSDYKGHNLVFIVGCPRSGTTWLQRLLACHPKVRTGQESDLFDLYIGPQLRAWRRELDPKTSGRGGVGLACYLREHEFLRILREYMLNLLEPMVRNLEPDEIFLEKTPSHALFIPEIMELLPESRIIHVWRDVRDVVASLLAASKSWGAYWAPGDARTAASMWVEHVRAVREAARGLSRERFYEVGYEALHGFTSRVLQDVCQFLRLEWDEKCIDGAVEKNSLEAVKAGGGTAIPVGGEFARISGSVAQEPAGFLRKARPGAWKEDLSWIEKVQVWVVARKVYEVL